MGASGPQRDGRTARRCASCRSTLAADNSAPLCGNCIRARADELRTPPAPKKEFFETDQFRAAFESEHIGKVFRAYRNHPRHLQLFGKALSQDLLGRWLGLTQAQVSKLENARNPEQNLDVLRRWTQTLHIPQDFLWFDLPGQSRLGREVDRQGKISSIATSTSLLKLPNLADDHYELTVNTNQVQYVSRLKSARLHFERMYRNSGGPVTRARIEQYLARNFAPPMTLTDSDGRMDHQRAIGGLIALAGVCAYDSEDWAAANSYFLQALNVGQVLRDTGFQGYVLALMTNQALALEDYRAAHQISNSALSLIGEAKSSLAVDLQVMNIKSLAFQADKQAALRGLRELEGGFASGAATSSIAEVSYAQNGHLHAGIAEALMAIGDFKSAEQYADTSIKSGSHARGKVNQLASLAALQISKGEIERASSLAVKMVEAAHGMESRRLTRRFVEVRRSLTRGAPSVSREAVDTIDEFIAFLM